MDIGHYTSRPGNTKNQLYVDGGVVLKNPSPIGGTYAYRLLKDGVVVSEGGFFRSAKDCAVNAEAGPVTNNITEMMALVKGLQKLPDDWDGTIYSDSMITLGRAFLGWKWKSVPLWLRVMFETEVKRLVNWERLGHALLSGHPTKAQLASGIGKHGLPVSEHNVWCDQACTEAAGKEKDRLGLSRTDVVVTLGT
jgi:ribonuclease HI